MDAPQPQPEGSPNPEATDEKLNVYELTPTQSDEEKILDRMGTPEAKTASVALPQSQTIEEEAKKKMKEQSLLNLIETGLKIKKPAPQQSPDGDEKPKTPESVWVQLVQKVIKLYKRQPYVEQQKAQALEEGYLAEHDIKLKDNGEKK